MAEHAKVMLESIFMGGNASGRGTIFESVNVISVFIGSSHGTFHTTVRKETGDNNILNFALSVMGGKRK